MIACINILYITKKVKTATGKLVVLCFFYIFQTIWNQFTKFTVKICSYWTEIFLCMNVIIEKRSSKMFTWMIYNSIYKSILNGLKRVKNIKLPTHNFPSTTRNKWVFRTTGDRGQIFFFMDYGYPIGTLNSQTHFKIRDVSL